MRNGKSLFGRTLGATIALLLLHPPPSASAGGPRFIPAEKCGMCHVETYESWSRTFHALAAIDPVFVESLERTEKVWGAAAVARCRACHSPAAPSGSPDGEDSMAREGVTCSFCHSVIAVDRGADRNRFTVDPSRLAAGLAGEGVGEHHFGRHDLMTSSEFCAGCHELTNGQGVGVLSTYSEWKDSPYAAEKTTCQGCHMPSKPGSGPGAEKSKTLRAANLHFQMGGHSQDQLSSAARLDASHGVEGKRIFLDVDVTNSRAGHKLPTGIPSRKLLLVAELFDREGSLVRSETREYSRTIVDGEGRSLEDFTDQLMLGAGEVADTRISPRETRREQFVFETPAERDFLLLEVSLIYEIVTSYLSPPILRFDVARKRIPVFPRDGAAAPPSSVHPSLLLIALLFIAVTYIMVRILFGKKAPRSPDRGRKE